MTIISTTIILAPVEQVWNALLDPEMSFEWLPQLNSVQHFSGQPDELESQTQLNYSENNQEVKVIQKLLEEIPLKLIKVKSRVDSMQALVSYKLSEINDYTKLKVTVEMTPNTSIQGLFLHLQKFSLQQNIRQDFHRLKLRVEREL
jgi:uncharacterized protein YndB with AHSA1/START domain